MPGLILDDGNNEFSWKLPRGKDLRGHPLNGKREGSSRKSSPSRRQST